MKASISRFIQRTKPYRLAVAFACAFTVAVGVAWAQTRIDPSGANATRYQEMLDAMEDSQFATFCRRMRDDEDTHFYLEVVPHR
jgi:hypothetical protein